MTTATAPAAGKLGFDPIQEIRIEKLQAAPENDRLYRPIDHRDPEIIALAAGMTELGIQEPLIVTADYYVVSGHRRLAAAHVANLEHVPCRVLDFNKNDNPHRFMQLLRECNRQRVKTFAETLREQAIDADPEIAYESLIEHRCKQSEVDTKSFAIQGQMRRAKITSAKMPFLLAIKRSIKEQRAFWPLSDRRIHYALLNNPPLRHASKPDSVYRNDKESYKSLTELLTRARVAGIIPMDVIFDPTRPVNTWDIYPEVGSYLREEIDNFGRSYYRDLMQSQPNHIEIVGEKNTLASTI